MGIRFRKAFSTPDHQMHPLVKLWPIFLAYSIVSFIYSAVLINIVNISGLIWPGQAFHQHAVQSGLILSIRSWMWAGTGLIFGILADRFQRKGLFAITSGFTAISCLLFGFIPEDSGSHLYILFILANAICGIGLGGNYPIVSSITNDALDENQRSQFFGIYYALNLITSNAGMIIAAIAFDQGWWQLFFKIIGMGMIITIILLFIFYKEPPRAHKSSEVLAAALKATKTEYQFQLNRKTFRQSIMKPTNIVAIIEGIFTCILFEVILFLIIPYLKEPPLSIDSNNVSILFVVFALPAIILSALVFAQKADKLAKRGIKVRVDFIIASVSISVIGLILAFLLPLENLASNGNIQWGDVIQKPIFWIFGFLIFCIVSARVLYLTNQPPVIQAINLPEAQGFISSVNQFLEIFASGLAPLIGAAALQLTTNNYLLTAFICSAIGIPGAFLWIYARKRIDEDIANINQILEDRAQELHQASL